MTLARLGNSNIFVDTNLDDLHAKGLCHLGDPLKLKALLTLILTFVPRNVCLFRLIPGLICLLSICEL